MTEKKTLDLRGSQARLARLLSFDRRAFTHMLFYRLLIPVSIIYGIVLLGYLVHPALAPVVKGLTLLVWVLFFPQLYESFVAFSLIQTKGLVFSHLNEAHLALMRNRYGRRAGLYSFLPYILIVGWALGFVIALVWWPQ